MLLLYCTLNANLNDTALCMVKLTSVTSRVSADISTAIMSLSSSLSAGQGGLWLDENSDSSQGLNFIIRFQVLGIISTTCFD